MLILMIGKFRLVKFNLCSFSLLSTLVVFAIASLEVALASPLLEKLGVPPLDAPYRLRGKIAGYQVDLKLPQNLEMIDQMPNVVKVEVKQRIEYRNANLPRLHQVTVELDRLLGSVTLHQTPEYRRSLSEVIIALHPSDGELSDPLYRHWPLLEKLPSYSRVHLFLPTELEERAKTSLGKAELEQRISVVAVDTWLIEEAGIELKHATTRWAQDLFEVAVDIQGNQYVLAPVTRYQINDLTRPDNDYLISMQNERTSIVKLPIYFRGGNILLGEAGEVGKRILFVGQRELDNNINDFYTAVFSPPKTDGVLEVLKQITGADEVFVLPSSKHLFHLDMAMVFLGKRKVAVLDPVDYDRLTPEDKSVLVALHDVLAKLGFEIVRVPTTTQWMANFQSTTNVIPYTDKVSGKMKVLMPLFPDTTVIMKGKPHSLNALVVSAYQRAGLEVVPVEDRFHSRSGSLHCSLNVLN